MTEQPAEIAAAGILEARIIRACTVHDTCPLTCKLRKVEELGEIASFDHRDEGVPPSIMQRLKEGVFQWLH